MIVETLVNRMTVTSATVNGLLFQPLHRFHYDPTTITLVGTDQTLEAGMTVAVFLLEFVREPTAISGTTWAGLIGATGGQVRAVLLPATAGGNLVVGASARPELPLAAPTQSKWGVIFTAANDSGADVTLECNVQLRREHKEQARRRVDEREDE